MSIQDRLDPISVLPNRFGLADFSPRETEIILGADKASQAVSAENFNWLAAYLCQEAGIYENEVPEWFRSTGAGLGRRSPLAVWPTKDGFVKVFEYAQQYKAQVDEDLAGEPQADDLRQSYEIAGRALGMILESFAAAGAEVIAPSSGPLRRGCSIHNIDDSRISAHWKRIGDMEDYRVTLKDGPRLATYFIVRHLAMGPEPLILQSGIGRHIDGCAEGLDLDTDLDGRAPGVNEVASFVVPLANEAKNRSLRVWAQY